jgi:hypothetical protein
MRGQNESLSKEPYSLSKSDIRAIAFVVFIEATNNLFKPHNLYTSSKFLFVILS